MFSEESRMYSSSSKVKSQLNHPSLSSFRNVGIFVKSFLRVLSLYSSLKVSFPKNSSEKRFKKYICFVFFSKVEFILVHSGETLASTLSVKSLLTRLIDTKFFLVAIVNVFDVPFEVFVCFILSKFEKVGKTLSKSLSVSN